MKRPEWTPNRGATVVPGILMILIMILGVSVPRETRANSGEIFLETLGISIAVGTVLGVSTLPFYDQPGKHVANLGYGAAAGAVTAVAIGIYGLISGRSQDIYRDARGLPTDGLFDESDPAGRVQSRFAARSRNANLSNVSAAKIDFTSIGARISPSAISMPLVSLNW